MTITVQAHVFSILIISAILAVIILVLHHALMKFDIYSKPTGLAFVALTVVEMVDDTVRRDVNEEIFDYLGPYVGYLWGYIFLSSISGLFGNQAIPTGNFSCTLTLAIISILMVEINSIRFNGIKAYVSGLFEPIFLFLPMNLVGKISPVISMSLRLFANVLAGSIIMSLFYTFTAWVSSFIPVIGVFDILGVAIAPIFHAYFDLFSSLLQTFIFTSLTTAFIGKELPSD